ncbi:Mov34/MPN/PAD-1 family protein [Tengunoibacter tsumagoiensis]|uniref:Mov34/MPN/PAD-1 family protein n=1 Tax=Tengunoibacter tsumagoiensis TaxID=2014871 RepID=A0A401ZZC3_9CHLR|nr:M67 family metallopeptidase [Tengunoibacter tsumagoiensis]GCE12210.1 Mov34/MPN/PAD-1 family protein [Tengunoibacter tsumagoiensis]
MVAESSLVLRIPAAIYEQMVAHVVAGYPNEACGALGSQGDLVVKDYPTDNAAEEPDDFSIISEADIVRIYNDIDEYDGDMIYYHSHPQSEAYPSARDIDWAKRSGYLYVIFSLQYHPKPPYARLFKIDSAGSVTEGSIEII